MRLLKIVLIAAGIAVALTAGLVVTAIIVAGLTVFLAVRHLLRRATGTESVRPLQPPSRANRAHDVIDVTATEVPLDPSSR